MAAEEEKFKKRILDLANACYTKGYACFTGFLDLNEQSIYHRSKKELTFVSTGLWGGYELAERQMLAFRPDALSLCEAEYPIRCLQVRVSAPRYAEPLTHRDYLGSVLGLGIDRSKIGDILVRTDGADVLCEETMAGWLADELSRVRHTEVHCTVAECEDLNWKSEVKVIEGSLMSVRLDAILPLLWKGSRSSLSGLITQGKVFVNGRSVTDVSFHPKEGDVISVRGFGKCRLLSTGTGTTRKGRTVVTLEKYI